MDCTVCGGDNREGARFCRHCGAALAAVSDTDEALPMAETEPEVSPPPERSVVEGEGLAVAPAVEGEAVLEEEVQPASAAMRPPARTRAGAVKGARRRWNVAVVIWVALRCCLLALIR